MLTPELTSRFAEIALGHVTQEYPNKLDQVLTGAADLRSPRELHPIFFGSFDWHSCVHAYWLLARSLRRYPEIPQSGRIRALFSSAFTSSHVSAELAFLSGPYTATFERPYGWAWLLMLAAELARHDDEVAKQWAGSVALLADEFAQRFLAWLPKASYATRTGVHSNTAFALALATEYASAQDHHELARLLSDTARRWYLDDADCQAWEPGGEDFLSPCLMEAECMRRILPRDEFSEWFHRFLPRLEQQRPQALFAPVAVSDRSDGRIVHLDGLNLSRSWCWSSLAGALAETDPRRAIMIAASNRHLEASLPHVSDHYMGTHWLATFAALALEAHPAAT